MNIYIKLLIQKIILTAFLGAVICLNTFAEENLDLKSSPFTFEGSYIGEGVANLSGGIKTGTDYLGMANIRLGFDTEKAGFWKGGSFFVNLANTHGGTPSEKLIGDFQVASNIEAGNHTYMQELWYAQQLGKLTITAGLQDLNAEFANSEHGALYRNSSFGIHSTIADNVPAPIFPLTTPGITLKWNFLPEYQLLTAIYDGSPIEFEHNPHNLAWNLDVNDGVFLFTEFQRENLIKSLPKGNYKLGAYYHKHKLTDEEIADGYPNDNYGFYGVVDQMIWEKEEGQGIAVFAQGSFSPENKNEHCYYLGGGINIYGIGKRSNDVLGLGVAHAGFKGQIKDETAFELTYKATLNENLYLQPDFYYIIHPSGTGMALKNAVVAAIRLGLEF